MESKYLISIDVGIVNLAYCVFQLSDNQTNIVDWNVVNMLNSTTLTTTNNNNNNNMSTELICMCCKKKAVYKLNKLNKLVNTYCTIHAKKTNYLLDHKIKKSILTKLPIDQIHIIINNMVKNIDIITIISKTKTETINNFINYLETNTLTKIKESKKGKSNANHVDLITLCKNMTSFLNNNIINKYKLDYAIIENQIGPLANRMKTIQGMLVQYFVCNHVSNIEFISSQNKLKSFHSINKNDTNKNDINKNDTNKNDTNKNDTDKNDTNKNDTDKTQYKLNKKNGIVYCRQLLQNMNTQWLSYFELCKQKKDDLADSYLQGMYYINLNKL